MAGFDSIKLISRITLLVMINTDIANAQQYIGGSKQSNVIIDYSVIEALSPPPTISQKNHDQLNKRDLPKNTYVGPDIGLSKAGPVQHTRKIDVIVLQPPKSIDKSGAKHAEKQGTNQINGNSVAKEHKSKEVRPPPSPSFLAPKKTIKALPTPNFPDLINRSAPPPPAFPMLEQVVRLPPISSIKIPNKKFLPAGPTASKREAKAETQVVSLPSIDQSIKGETINSIEFNAGSFDLNSEASTALKKLSKTLEKNSALRLQLHAYASLSGGSAIRAKRLSLSRALATRAYLIGRGVDIMRISVMALGNQPTAGSIDRIDLILTKR